eukprot:COSAG04_NODE_1002_length_8834_cov_10.753520_3_plen_519_part_00
MDGAGAASTAPQSADGAASSTPGAGDAAHDEPGQGQGQPPAGAPPSAADSCAHGAPLGSDGAAAAGSPAAAPQAVREHTKRQVAAAVMEALSQVGASKAPLGPRRTNALAAPRDLSDVKEAVAKHLPRYAQVTVSRLNKQAEARQPPSQEAADALRREKAARAVFDLAAERRLQKQQRETLTDQQMSSLSPEEITSQAKALQKDMREKVFALLRQEEKEPELMSEPELRKEVERFTAQLFQLPGVEDSSRVHVMKLLFEPIFAASDAVLPPRDATATLDVAPNVQAWASDAPEWSGVPSLVENWPSSSGVLQRVDVSRGDRSLMVDQETKPLSHFFEATQGRMSQAVQLRLGAAVKYLDLHVATGTPVACAMKFGKQTLIFALRAGVPLPAPQAITTVAVPASGDRQAILGAFAADSDIAHGALLEGNLKLDSEQYQKHTKTEDELMQSEQTDFAGEGKESEHKLACRKVVNLLMRQDYFAKELPTLNEAQALCSLMRLVLNHPSVLTWVRKCESPRP